MMARSTGTLNTTDEIATTTLALIGHGLQWDVLSAYVPYQIGKFIKEKLFFVCVSIGIPGNILSIVTLLRSGSLNSSIIYLLVLAVLDSLNLAMKVFLVILLEYNQTFIGDLGCKSLGFFAKVLMYLPVWTTLLLTIERFVAVRYPFRVSSLFTKRRAAISIALVTVLVCVVNIHQWFIWHEARLGGNVKSCIVRPDYQKISRYLHWFDSSVYVFIPCTLLAILNATICIYLAVSNRKKDAMTSGGGCSEAVKQNNAITKMLITVSVVTLILMLPYAFALAIRQNDWNFNGDYNAFAWVYFVYWFIIFCSDLNSAINFFLYVLSGRKFRAVFVSTFIPCARRAVDKETKSNATASTSAASRSNTTL